MGIKIDCTIINRINPTGWEIKDALTDLITDYRKQGLSHKAILKEMEAVIYWELITNGFKK